MISFTKWFIRLFVWMMIFYLSMQTTISPLYHNVIVEEKINLILILIALGASLSISFIKHTIALNKNVKYGIIWLLILCGFPLLISGINIIIDLINWTCNLFSIPGFKHLIPNMSLAIDSSCGCGKNRPWITVHLIEIIGLSIFYLIHRVFYYYMFGTYYIHDSIAYYDDDDDINDDDDD